MNLSFYIAHRYLFSKKSHNAINIISMISVCGVMVVTCALICALSVYNGFSDLIFSTFSNFDPDLKITPQEGKVFDPTTKEFQKIKNLPGIDCYSEILQDNALIRYKERQVVATLVGVDEGFQQLTQIDSTLIDGRFLLNDGVANYATLGIGLASSLGINAGFVTPLELYVPKRDERVNLANPASSFKLEYCYIAAVFSVNQPAYDQNLMLVPISLTRSLFNYEKEVTAIELKLKENTSTEQIKKDIKNILGDSFIIQDRHEQQATSFRMINLEKWMTFFILCFILLIASFNVIGSLSMLMIEKKNDARILQSLGADNALIRKIFLTEGWLISLCGAIGGLLLGLLLCTIQEKFGVISLGNAGGAFIIDAYPVRVEWADTLIVFATVAIIDFFTSWYPVHYLGKKWLSK